jgi:hypothetical protein
MQSIREMRPGTSPHSCILGGSRYRWPVFGRSSSNASASRLSRNARSVDAEVSKSEPKPSEDAWWKQDREEKGIVTWVVRVPTGTKGADVVFETEVTYPKGANLVRQ